MSVSLLALCGSLRAGSVNEAVLRSAAALAPAGTDVALYEGMAGLPHFNPDDDGQQLHVAVSHLRAALGGSDAVLICTPEYAGALPGSFKNLLDWTVGGAEMDRRPVAWINASGPAAPTGGAGAHDSLRAVLGYVNAEIVEAACVAIPVVRSDLGADGLVAQRAAQERIAQAVAALAAHVSR